MIGALLTAGSGCGEGTSESTRVEGSAAAGRHVNKQQRAERRRAARRHRARVRTQRAAIRHARRAAAHRQRQADQARAHQRALVAAEAQAAKEAAAEEEASECDPNYAGACLNPYSSDYDCEGGSGNGPDYTGEVTVVGEDHYGLDADSDGIGCEPY
jgi:FKBP-type peptidyl-prolyl cis-trans isomerase